MFDRSLIEVGRRWLHRYFEKLGSLQHHGVKGQKWGVKNGPPYPLNRDENTHETLKNAAGKDIIVVEKTLLIDKPDSITQVRGRRGGLERNYYDHSGRQIKQISNNDHGNAKKHPYGKHGEHAHDYIYDANGKMIDRVIRELTDEERKENSDIL